MSSKSISPSTIALLILTVCAALIHFGGNTFKQSLLAQSTLQVLQRDPPAQSTTTPMPTINVIQEESPGTPTPITSGMPEELPNRLFASLVQPITAPVTPPATEQVIDYFSNLSTSGLVHLDAVMHNGAIINGTFVSTGGQLDDFGYPSGGNNTAQRITPKLTRITGNSVTIREPSPPYRTFKLSLE